MCKALRAVEDLLLGYKRIQGGFEGLWNIGARGWQRNWVPSSGMVSGVSNAREGSKILSFLYRPRLVCSSLLHLRSLWKVHSATSP